MPVHDDPENAPEPEPIGTGKDHTGKYDNVPAKEQGNDPAEEE